MVKICIGKICIGIQFPYKSLLCLTLSHTNFFFTSPINTTMLYFKGQFKRESSKLNIYDKLLYFTNNQSLAIIHPNNYQRLLAASPDQNWQIQGPVLHHSGASTFAYFSPCLYPVQLYLYGKPCLLLTPWPSSSNVSSTTVSVRQAPPILHPLTSLI